MPICDFKGSHNCFMDNLEPNYHTDMTGNDNEKLRLIQLIVNVYIDGIFCVLGYIGNTLVLVVTRKDKTRNSHVLLLQALAVYDILFLIHTMLYTVLRTVYPTTGLMGWYYAANDIIIAFDLPFGWIAQTGTIWITMLLALDRYIAISRPFKAMVWCSVGNTLRAIMVTTILAVLFNAVRFPHYFLVAAHSDSNSTFIGHIKTDLPGWNSDLYHYLYHIALTLLFLFIIPLTSLFVFNVCLIRALSDARQRRVTMASSTKSAATSQSNIIVIFNVIIVITKFLVCETPDFIAGVLGTFDSISDSEAFAIFGCFKEMLLVFNSTFNFYIYLLFNSRFRIQLVAALPCCISCCPCCFKSVINRAQQTTSSSICSRAVDHSPNRQIFHINNMKLEATSQAQEQKEQYHDLHQRNDMTDDTRLSQNLCSDADFLDLHF